MNAFANVQAIVKPVVARRTTHMTARRLLHENRRCVASVVRSQRMSTSTGGDAAHHVSGRRLQQFLEAEVTHFASMPRLSLTLADLLRVTTSPRALALLVHEEIPKHFAARLRQIEDVPDWRDFDDLCEVHNRYSDSFNDMRMLEVGADLSEFTEAVLRLKKRQRPAINLIGQVRDRIRKSAPPQQDREFWERWLTSFFISRISTEMVTSQYLAVIEQTEHGASAITGIVDAACDPAVICREAAKIAQEICLERIGVEPEVHIEVRSKTATSFSYVGRYLHYILIELLKSRCEATAQSAFLSSIVDPVPAKPIHVVICSDDHRVAIRIRDLSGGVPFDRQHRVWDWLCPGYATDHLYDVPNDWMPDSGYTLGLPQVKTVVEYLGGEITLKSLPDWGDDFHLFLPRIDIAPFLTGSVAPIKHGPSSV